MRYSLQDKDKYFETEGHHESIINEKIFMLAQEKISNIPKQNRTKRPRDDNYFCGALICGKCGSKYTTHNYASKDERGKNVYKGSYRCINRRYFNKENTCTSGDIAHWKVEQAFNEYIEKYDALTETGHLNFNNEEKKKLELAKSIADCENKLNACRKKKQQVLEQYINEEISFSEYKDMLKVVDKKHYVLEQEISNLKAQEEVKSAVITEKDLMRSLKDNWNYLNNNERMMFVQRFMKKIIVTVEKESRNSSIAIIDGIEFDLSSELIWENNHKSGTGKKYKAVKKESIRKTLKNALKKNFEGKAKKAVRGTKARH